MHRNYAKITVRLDSESKLYAAVEKAIEKTQTSSKPILLKVRGADDTVVIIPIKREQTVMEVTEACRTEIIRLKTEQYNSLSEYVRRIRRLTAINKASGTRKIGNVPAPLF